MFIAILVFCKCCCCYCCCCFLGGGQKTINQCLGDQLSLISIVFLLFVESFKGEGKSLWRRVKVRWGGSISVPTPCSRTPDTLAVYRYLEGVHCSGGISSVHWGLFNALGDIISTLGDIISTLGGIMICVGILRVH